MNKRILTLAVFAASLSATTMRAQVTQANNPANSPSTTDTSAASTAVVQVDPAQMETMNISKVAPVYPLEAKNAAIEGDVVLYAVIDEKGKVKSLDVLSGLEILRIPALTAVNQWRYAPFIVNELPVNVGTIITIHFRLSGNELPSQP